MSLVALHNGGGVGIGKAINGGFGMVCDGSERVDRILRSSMLWSVRFVSFQHIKPKPCTLLYTDRRIFTCCCHNFTYRGLHT